MTTTEIVKNIHHYCIGLSYLCAFLLEIARLLWPARGWRVAGLVFGAAGLFAHTAYLLVQQPSPAVPSGSVLMLAWVLALFYFYGTVHHARQAWAVFVLPVVIGLVVVSRILLTAEPEHAAFDVGEWASGERFWGGVHGLLILFASVGVSVSFLASMMYLIQARRLRNKVSPGTVVPMLSLERLETMNRRALNIAFPLLTAGLLVGTLLLPHGLSFGDNWLSLKVLSTAGLWLEFLVLLYLRYGAHVPARRLALFSIAAFGLLLVALAASHPFAIGGVK
ncbi:Cytochrome C assembly protein [Gemmata sp. SH-PL17]|uniref:cytochrome c biogenesis protein CcsA n=1 Tax=Gemmata sp. SH-PL17 TaxID=1630693 RepID=UPI00078D8C62|nr:cytochrome c biogenesis protein CcsA [Gemmata sp. SH-PL17]AMV28336.1 Cytochrome C assembly protein [Gemmata sp. SH-PL17]